MVASKLTIQQICDALPKQDTVQIKEQASLYECLDVMLKKNLRSLFVTSSKITSGSILDMRDIVDMMGEFLRETRSQDKSETPYVGLSTLHQFLMEERNLTEIKKKKKSAILEINLMAKNLFEIFDQSPRVIITQNNQFVRVLSVSDVLLALQKLQLLGKVFHDEKMLLTDMPSIISHQVRPIEDTDTLGDVIELILVTGFSAFPILLNHDKPITVFSIRDLRYLIKKGIFDENVLNEPALDYISTVRQKFDTYTKYPFIHVDENSSLHQMVEKMVASEINRIIVMKNNKISGLLSITDIAKIVPNFSNVF